MPKPTKTPQWLTDVNAADLEIAVEATPAKKNAGWGDAEKIPSEGLNFWMWLVWKWIEWLSVGAEVRTYHVPACDGQPNPPTYSGAGATGWLFLGGGGGAAKWVGQAGTGTGAGVSFPLRVETGQRLTAVRAYVKGHGTAAVDIYIIRTNKTTGAVTVYGYNTSVGATVQMIFYPVSFVNTADDFLECLLVTHGATSNDQLEIYGVEFDVDRP